MDASRSGLLDCGQIHAGSFIPHSPIRTLPVNHSLLEFDTALACFANIMRIGHPDMRQATRKHAKRDEIHHPTRRRIRNHGAANERMSRKFTIPCTN